MGSEPHTPDAARAMTAAAAALVGFGVCLAMFLPPMVETTTASVGKTVLFAVALAVCVVAHLVFVGIAARRLHRRPWVWVLVSLVAFPVTSIVGMIVLGFLEDERHGAASEAR